VRCLAPHMTTQRANERVKRFTRSAVAWKFRRLRPMLGAIFLIPARPEPDKLNWRSNLRSFARMDDGMQSNRAKGEGSVPTLEPYSGRDRRPRILFGSAPTTSFLSSIRATPAAAPARPALRSFRHELAPRIERCRLGAEADRFALSGRVFIDVIDAALGFVLRHVRHQWNLCLSSWNRSD